MRYEVNAANLEERDEFYLINCKNFRDPMGPPLGSSRPAFVRVGVTKRYIERSLSERNLFLLGRIFGILPVELPRITSAHSGLGRPMRVGQNSSADSDKILVVMHPTADCLMILEENGPSDIKETPPLQRQNFTATLTPNSDLEKYPEVAFWLEHCNWVDSDQYAPQFPAEYNKRYGKPCIWVG